MNMKYILNNSTGKLKFSSSSLTSKIPFSLLYNLFLFFFLQQDLYVWRGYVCGKLKWKDNETVTATKTKNYFYEGDRGVKWRCCCAVLMQLAWHNQAALDNCICRFEYKCDKGFSFQLRLSLRERKFRCGKNVNA